jgi:hypothetical protein
LGDILSARQAAGCSGAHLLNESSWVQWAPRYRFGHFRTLVCAQEHRRCISTVSLLQPVSTSESPQVSCELIHDRLPGQECPVASARPVLV